MRKACPRFAAVVALIAVLGLLPTSAVATTPTAAPFPVTTPYVVGGTTATPIQHLVVIFQENVSFDHYFGTYPDAMNPANEPKFTAAPGTPIPNNYISHPNLLTNNPNKDSGNNTVNPFRLDRTENVTCDQDHNYDDEQKAADGSATGTTALKDQYVTVGTAHTSGCAHVGTEEMGYFDGNTVTGMWNLAQHFAMSDNSWGTGYGPSTPGALNLVAGQTSGVGSTLNSLAGFVGSDGHTVVGDPDPFGDDCSSPTRGQVAMTTSVGAGTGPLNIGDVLNAKHLSWGWFQGGFRPTAVNGSGVATCGAKHFNDAGNSIADYNAHHSAFQYFPSTSNPHHLPPLSPTQIGQPTDQANHEYDESDFFTALQAHALPAVSFLKGANYQDGHAGTTESDPLEEQTFLADSIDSLEQSPEWSSTAVVIMYDDSDGWYDHVFHAPVNPSSDHGTGTPATDWDFLNSGTSTTATACGTAGQGGALTAGPLFGFQDRCGPGDRQPLLVISPWAKQNYIDNTFTDQTSVIKFIEENWGTGGLGGGAFESESGLNPDGSQAGVGVGDLMGMFDFDRSAPRAPAVILNDQTGEVEDVDQGPAGPAGPQGPAGSNGANGANGANGTNGTNGAPGTPGAQGAQGVTGAQGPQGLTGPKGDTGQSGAKGDTGAAGAQGPKGDKGDPGATPHVVCTAKQSGKKITVKCTEVGTRSKARSVRVSLTRGKRIYARADGTLSATHLKVRHRLHHGLYMLTVVAKGAAVDKVPVIL